MQSLSAVERTRLLMLHKKERDSRICDRIKVVLWMDDGWSAEQIAKALFIQPTTVAKHLKAYQQNRKLAPANGGSVSKLSLTQTNELIAHLQKVQ